MAATGSTEQKQLEKGNVYLVKVYSSLQEIYVERIAKTAYKLRKERTDGTWYVEWVEKSNFERHYKILEYLDAPPMPPQLEVEKPLVTISGEDLTKECPVCGGTGQVPDNTVTSGQTTCPKCLGSGRVWK
jgi:hypothetical protein